MKEKFLTIVEEVKATGIAESFCKTSNAEELTLVWNKFTDENSELIQKIKEWAEEFKKIDRGCFIEREDTVENPMEIAITIFIIDDKVNLSECAIFEDYDDLISAMREIGGYFYEAVANLVEADYICDITPKQIFSVIEELKETEDTDSEEKSEAEPEDGEENADCGEESDADEADSGINLAETEEN